MSEVFIPLICQYGLEGMGEISPSGTTLYQTKYINIPTPAKLHTRYVLSIGGNGKASDYISMLLIPMSIMINRRFEIQKNNERK